MVEAVIAKEPANEMLLLSRTRILVSMNQAQAAIPELEAYIQTEEGSRSVSAIVTLADLYRLNGDFTQAQKKIEQAAPIDPDNQSVIHTKLLLLIAQKRFDEIPEVCSAYLKIEEPKVETMTAAASILASINSPALKKEGLKFYERIISLSPSLPAQLGLASTLYQTGDIPGAKQAYRKVLDQYPDNIQALNDLAWILQENDKNYADALELAKKGLAVASDAKDRLHLLDTEGTILSNMPDGLESARLDFTRLVDMSPDDTHQKAKALLKLGRICIKLEDLENAKQHMKYALEIDKKINVLTPDERSEIAKVLQEE
jgi:tetratricopeptide (TPR) repeat protein